jgi:hypothetical protein
MTAHSSPYIIIILMKNSSDYLNTSNKELIVILVLVSKIGGFTCACKNHLSKLLFLRLDKFIGRVNS